MALLSVWKTKRNILCYVLILYLIIGGLFLSGCDPVGGKYPYQVAEKWVCTDPEIFLVSQQMANNTRNFTNQLIWENQEIDIDVHYQSNTFFAYFAGAVDESGMLFHGTWRYSKGNLIFTIEEDFIFDGAYSTLVFQQG